MTLADDLRAESDQLTARAKHYARQGDAMPRVSERELTEWGKFEVDVTLTEESVLRLIAEVRRLRGLLLLLVGSDPNIETGREELAAEVKAIAMERKRN